MGGAGLPQPIRLVFQQRLDFGGGERLVHVVAFEGGNGDAEFLRYDGPGVRARASQSLQPFGRVGVEFRKLCVGDRGGLELLWRGGQVDAQLFAAVCGFMAVPDG